MDTRRDFVKMIVNGAVLFPYLRAHAQSSVPAWGSNTSTGPTATPVPRNRELGDVMVDDPYADVDWRKVTYVTSTSHVHVETQEKLDLYYRQFGLRHFPISNYYPSAPTYPIKSIRYNQYRVQQDFGLIYNPDNTKPGVAKWAAGNFVEGPFRWNDVLMKGPHSWFHELPPEKQAQLPFELGDLIFKNIPDDIVVSPNAEHHGFTDSGLHANAVGSLYSSGNFDAHDEFRTQEHGYAIGTGLPWETAFQKMLDELLFPDGGGITINHPISSRLAFGEITRMLDFDPRVLGIEVYNDTDTYAREAQPLLALELWDEILRTGRRCLGFFVPDHTIARGKNVLLVPSFTERECLRAYRKGAFIGTLIGTGPQFTRISLDKRRVSVTVNAPMNLRFITDRGLGQESMLNHPVQEMDYLIPMGPDGRPSIAYIRVEAVDHSSTEQLFSQPIRFLK
jgi:hypothetical protein